MTNKEIINEIKHILEELNYEDAVSYLTQNDKTWLKESIKALEQQPCEDCISREDILNHQYTIDESEALGISTRNVVNVDDILNAKPVTPQPKTGHWILVTNGRGGHECDICHEYAPSYQSGDEYLSKRCPNCGARMVKPQESGIEKRKPCINYEDGCEEWAGCPCVYYKVESETQESEGK